MGSFVKEHLKAASRLFYLNDFQYNFYLTQKEVSKRTKYSNKKWLKNAL